MDKREILLSLLGRETVSPAAKKAADAVEDLGDSMKETASDATKLDREIEQAERSLRDLAVQYARTDDAAQRMDLTKAMRKQQAELRRLARVRDLLPDPEPEAQKWGVQFAAKVGPVLVRAMPSALAGGGGIGAAIGAPIVAGLVTWMGTAAVGAALGGAAVGAVAGGIKIAARDPRVHGAGADLAAAIGDQLEDAAAPMVPATLGAIGKVRVGFQQLDDELESIFGDAADYVDPLTDAVVGLGTRGVKGFADLVRGARPVVDMLRTELPELGDDIGRSLSELAEHGPEAARALGLLLDVAGAGIKMTAQGLATMSTIFKIADLAAAAARGPEALAERAHEYNVAAAAAEDETFDWGAALAGLGRAAGGANTEVKSFLETLREMHDQTMEVERAQIEFEAKLDEVAAAAKRAKGGIDVNTKAGRENRTMLLDLVAVTKASADAIKARTGSDDLAAQATERGRQAFLRAAAAMRVEKAEAESLANQLFGIPNIQRSVKVDTKQAHHDVKTLRGLIAAIKNKNVVITVDVRGNTRIRVGGRNVPIGDGIGGLSGGGPVEDAPGPKGVDSKLYMLARGEHVLTAREVDAAGGHEAVERWRRSLTGGTAAGVAVPAGGSRVGGGAQVVEHRHTITIAGTGVLAGLRQMIRVQGAEASLGIRAEVVR